VERERFSAVTDAVEQDLNSRRPLGFSSGFRKLATGS